MNSLIIVLVSVLLHGVNGGSYRRVVEARGTVTVEQNQTVYGILSDCYDVPLFDLCTRERIGSAYDYVQCCPSSRLHWRCKLDSYDYFYNWEQHPRVKLARK